jgi:hypothetical protein
MKDFTKTQKDNKAVSLKCNTCSEIVKAFGIEPGDRCMGTPNTEGGLGRSVPNHPCKGKYMPFDGRTADSIKRRTDGAA